jgi:hypothetical protein
MSRGVDDVDLGFGPSSLSDIWSEYPVPRANVTFFRSGLYHAINTRKVNKVINKNTNGCLSNMYHNGFV